MNHDDIHLNLNKFTNFTEKDKICKSVIFKHNLAQQHLPINNPLLNDS